MIVFNSSSTLLSFTSSSNYEVSTTAIDALFNATITRGDGSQSERRNVMPISPGEKDLILYYSKIRTYIWTYVPPFIITVGLLCNLLSLVVWIQSLVKKRGSSSSYFFACLAIGDAIALLFLPMYDHIGKAYYDGIDLRNYSNFTCKFYKFMFPFSQSFSSYILASLAMFRMIGAIYPHKYKQICSPRNAKIIIGIIIAFTSLAHIQTIFRSKIDISQYGGVPTCLAPTRQKAVRLFWTLWMGIITYFIPMLIIVLSNICIIWKLVKKRMRSIRTTRLNQGDHAFARNLTVLIGISLVYFLTMFPMWVYVVLGVVMNHLCRSSRVEYLRYAMGWAIVSNICLVNFSANFFIYCLTHPQFVTEVKLCFGAFTAWCRSCLPMCKKPNVVGVIQVEEYELGTAGPSGINDNKRLVAVGCS